MWQVLVAREEEEEEAEAVALAQRTLDTLAREYEQARRVSARCTLLATGPSQTRRDSPLNFP